MLTVGNRGRGRERGRGTPMATRTLAPNPPQVGEAFRTVANPMDRYEVLDLR